MYRQSLVWILIIVSCLVLTFRLKGLFPRHRASGFLLNVGNFDPPENCEFRIPLVLHISADHSLRLNEEPVRVDQLPRWLDLIMKQREKPTLYVDGNSEMSMQELIQTLDLVRKINEKIEIRLVTSRNRKESCADFRPGPAT